MFVFAWRRKRSSYGTAAFLSFVQRTRDVFVTFQTCHVCATFLICMPIKIVAASRTSSCYVSRSISYVSWRCRGVPFVWPRMLIRRAYASLLRQCVTVVLNTNKSIWVPGVVSKKRWLNDELRRAWIHTVSACLSEF